jgi:PIN domain nuclease of toxin-antitoxin system
MIWAAEDALSAEAADAMTASLRDGVPVFLSPISAWELGMLMARRRYLSSLSPERWFERVTSSPGVRLTGMPPAVLIASSFLPGTPPRDPADRIIAATAREYDYTVVTRDKPLLAYAEQGHLRAMGC